MHSIRKKKAGTFGAYIADAFKARGSRRGIAIVQHAVNAHLLKFQTHQRFLIS